MIHLVEADGEKPKEGEIVRTKCNKELTFRPFTPSLERMLKICVDCDTRGPTRIPNYLAVLESSRYAGA